MLLDIDYQTPIERYHGTEKPPMPIHFALRSPLPLKLLCRTVLSIKITEEIDLKFLKDIVSDQKCPEFNGYNTKVIREKVMLS